MTASPKSPATWFLDGRSAVHAFGWGRCRLGVDAPSSGIAIEPADAGPSDVAMPPHGDRLLGVDLGSIRGATDHWLRGRDVAAVYEPDDRRRLRATAMWRLQDWPTGGGPTGAGPPGDGQAAGRGIACELILSAQTSILASDSELTVVTEFTEGRIVHGRPAGTPHGIAWHEATDHGSFAAAAPPGVTAVLVQRGPPRGPGSIGLVAVHPADVREIGIGRHDGRLRITCRLFTGGLEQTLEKGVLLQGRVFAAVAQVPAGGGARVLDRVAAAIGRFNASPPPITT